MKTMRERADIPKDRTYADTLTETAYAVLFYDPENPSDCCYRFCAVRQKEEDYFVLGGGDTSEVRDTVGGFPLRDTRDQALVSANAARVARIETGGGLIEMDSEQPFVLLLPRESELDFYDAEGNPVDALRPPSLVIFCSVL